MKTDTLTTSTQQRLNNFSIEDIGDDHLYTGLETPMRANAFAMSNDEKK